MHFVFLTLGYTPDLYGGGYRYATEVAELLARRGHEVHALYPKPDERLPARELRNGVKLHRLARGTGGFLSRWRTTNRVASGRAQKLLAEARQPTLLISHHAYLGPALRGRRHCTTSRSVGLGTPFLPPRDSPVLAAADDGPVRAGRDG